MGSALPLNTRSRSLEYSNAFTPPPSTQAPVWVLPFASGSFNASEAEFGWNPNSDTVRRFSLPSRPGKDVLSDAGGRKPGILLIEDNPADANIIREALEANDVHCDLLLINNGEQAIEFIENVEAQRSPCPDLVILDLNLPKKTGKEVLERMRASARCRNVAIVILTSSDSRRDRDDASRCGASAYLKKPSHLDEFLKLGGVFKGMIGKALS